MIHWSVEGRGVEVTVTSPEGDIYPFVITSAQELQLALFTSPVWQDGQAPEDADTRISAALGAASRWTQDMFGRPRN